MKTHKISTIHLNVTKNDILRGQETEAMFCPLAIRLDKLCWCKIKIFGAKAVFYLGQSKVVEVPMTWAAKDFVKKFDTHGYMDAQVVRFDVPTEALK